jgi:arylsulfatase A-like enzyme
MSLCTLYFFEWFIEIILYLLCLIFFCGLLTVGPMFLYFASQAVHDPFADCAAYSAYDGGIPSTYLSSDLVDRVTTSVVGDKRQQYAMSLLLLDQAVAEMYDALVTTKQLDNTYIIFASDNGACRYSGGKNAPLRGSKGTLFEGLLLYSE